MPFSIWLYCRFLTNSIFRLFNAFHQSNTFHNSSTTDSFIKPLSLLFICKGWEYIMLCSTRNLFSWWNKELLTPRHEPRESPMLRAECWTTKLSGHPSTRSVCFIYLCLLFLVFWTKHLVLNGTKNEANKLLLQRLNELCLLLLSLTWEVWMASSQPLRSTYAYNGIIYLPISKKPFVHSNNFKHEPMERPVA